MRFEIGNKVAVIDDVITGVVTKVSNDSVTLLSEGMSFTFHHSELVKIASNQNDLTKFSDINNSMLVAKTKEAVKKPSQFKRRKSQVVLEVDLHIEKLVKSTKGMDSYDILNYQLKTAKHKLEYCIQKRIPTLVLIHGVGEGVLKTELQYLLNKYPVSYTEASYRDYGLGATEISI